MDYLEIDEAAEALEEFGYECEVNGRELSVFKPDGRFVDILVSMGGIAKNKIDNLIEALGI